jgi:hypothetical protein
MLAHRINVALRLLGVDAPAFAAFCRRMPRYLRQRRQFIRLSQASAKALPLGPPVPLLMDYDAPAGAAAGAYFHQDLWAARKIYRARPRQHVDVGSRLDGFVAHLLPFMDVQVVDIRPMTSRIAGLSFVQADATRMSGFADDSVESLSSLHAIEHFGLGRYGDPLAPEACFQALHSLARVLRPGGRLYLSVPIGRERVEFNAQRVFSPHTILRELGALELVSFSAVDDMAGDLHENADPAAFAGARLACGLFEWTKSGAAATPAPAARREERHA